MHELRAVHVLTARLLVLCLLLSALMFAAGLRVGREEARSERNLRANAAADQRTVR